MLRATLASVAMIGTVLVTPARATVPESYEVEFTNLPRADVLDLLGDFIEAWSLYYDLTSDYVDVVRPRSIIAYFDDGTELRSFFANGSVNNGPLSGFAQMPVPGPIAGAGLPLLAAGLAFAAWRRRRAANAA